MEYYVNENTNVKLVTKTDGDFLNNNDGMDKVTRSIVKPAAKIHQCDKTIDDIIILSKSDHINAYDLNPIIDTIGEIDNSILADIASTILALLIEKKASFVVELKDTLSPITSDIFTGGHHPLFGKYELDEDEFDEEDKDEVLDNEWEELEEDENGIFDDDEAYPIIAEDTKEVD